MNQTPDDKYVKGAGCTANTQAFSSPTKFGVWVAPGVVELGGKLFEGQCLTLELHAQSPFSPDQDRNAWDTL